MEKPSAKWIGIAIVAFAVLYLVLFVFTTLGRDMLAALSSNGALILIAAIAVAVGYVLLTRTNALIAQQEPIRFFFRYCRNEDAIRAGLTPMNFDLGNPRVLSCQNGIYTYNLRRKQTGEWRGLALKDFANRPYLVHFGDFLTYERAKELTRTEGPFETLQKAARLRQQIEQHENVVKEEGKI